MKKEKKKGFLDGLKKDKSFVRRLATPIRKEFCEHVKRKNLKTYMQQYRADNGKEKQLQGIIDQEEEEDQEEYDCPMEISDDTDSSTNSFSSLTSIPQEPAFKTNLNKLYSNSRPHEMTLWNKNDQKNKDEISKRQYSRYRIDTKEFLLELCNGNLEVAVEVSTMITADLQSLVHSNSATKEEDAKDQVFKNLKDFQDLLVNSQVSRRTISHQHAVDAVLVAISSGSDNQEKVSSSQLANMLGIHHRKLLQAKSSRKQIESGVNIFSLLKTPKLREDNINEEKKIAIYNYCHDMQITQPDSNSNRQYSVINLVGAKEKHAKRNWIKKGNLSEQYERFITSHHYKSFQRQVCRSKPHVFNEDRRPTITEKKFRECCCKCVGNPTIASCVDMKFDKLLNFIEALNEYFLDNHYILLKTGDGEDLRPCQTALGRKSIDCECSECVAEKPSWLNIFNPERSSVSQIDHLLKLVLCPKTEEEDLTLDEDEWVHKMYGWDCGHGSCALCGIERLPWDCPNLAQNEEERVVLVWEDIERPGDKMQPELVEVKMKVSDIMKEFRAALETYIPHCVEKEWLNRTRRIQTMRFADDEILLFTDFSASMDLKPIKTDNCHVDRHAVLAVYYVLHNRRKVDLETGETINYNETDVWYAFGDSQEKGKKNDVIFHNAVLKKILSYYPSITRVKIWTDNCAAQYKCRQNFFKLSMIPYVHEHIVEAQHFFAQVHCFKGSWDAAGKVAKDQIRQDEESQKKRSENAFDCYVHFSTYCKDNHPDGVDWGKMVDEGDERLKRKTAFTTVKRKVCFVTDHKDEYDKLNSDGYENIIFTNRTEVETTEDTTVYEGTSRIHHAFTGEVDNKENVPEAGYCLHLKNYPCACSNCRGNLSSICKYKSITGDAETFHKISKESLMKQKKVAEETSSKKLIQDVQGLANKYNEETLKRATVADLNKMLSFMKIKAKRMMTEAEKVSGKQCGAPKRDDKLRAMPPWSEFLSKLEEASEQDNAVGEIVGEK